MIYIKLLQDIFIYNFNKKNHNCILKGVFMRQVLSLIVFSSLLLANEANLDIIKPVKEFAPPPIITPNVAQSAFVENQFDRT